MASVAYNPDDPVQASFLSALALGESGQNGSATTGFGGMSTAGSSVDQYGFPQWAGGSTSAGPTHAAGLFQFEPSTWDSIASKYGLNFSSASDQAEGAWYLAQEKDPNLYSDLQSGNLGTVQSDLASTWTSVNGNAAAPGGLANDIANGIGADISGSIGGGSASSTSGGSGSSSGGSSGGLITDIENWFLRGGLIIIGGLIALVALWMLLSNNGVVPGPKQVAKGLATA